MIRSSQSSQFHVYIDALKKLSEEFGIRFKDFRDIEKAFALFANPFTADIDNSPTDLQLELTDNQNESDLKSTYHEMIC